MKLKKLAVLCAFACAGLSGQAMAHLGLTEPGAEAAAKLIIDEANAGDDGIVGGPGPDGILGTADDLAGTADNRVIFISGASATQQGFTSILSSLLTGTPVRFANTTASSRNFEAAAGVLAGTALTAGPWAGKNVIIINRVKGGSVFGVNPVARAEALETLVVTAATCGALGSGTATSPYTCSLTPLNLDGTLAGTAALPSQVPHVGISDVAPALFQNPYNTEGETPAPALTATELAEFADPTYNKPIYTLAFGVPVTNNVTFAPGVGLDGSPNNLTRAAVSAIMTGNIGTWDQVAPFLANGTTARPADDIVVCRRVQGSGTQAVDNLYFGNYPCSDTLVNVPAARDASGAWDPVSGNYTVTAGTGGLVVIENSTSGDVRNCLTAAANPAGASYSTTDRNGIPKTVTFAATPGGHKAIGVLSMDSVASSDAATAIGWSFRALDGNGTLSCTGICPATTEPTLAGTGKFPTQANLINGTWDLQGWVSWNVPTRTIADVNRAPLALRFVAVAQDPAIIESLNNLKHVAAALPAPFSPYTGAGVSRAAYLNGNQCAPLNRNTSGL